LKIYPFSEKKISDTRDRELVESAIKGSRKAVEELVKHHQGWIYNIVLRMVGDCHAAEDVTQEILIKIITNLSSFRKKSSFRTWIYRIVTNHVINMKKRPAEKIFYSFKQYGEAIDNTPDMELPDTRSVPVDINLIIEEVRLHCMMGMLLCLDRKQRLAYILGDIFGVDCGIGSEIMEISKDNFRQKLSRARKQLRNFIKERCCLVKKDNSCKCERKTSELIRCGVVDPAKLQFNSNYMQRIKSLVPAKLKKLDNIFESRCRKLFREQPFQESEHVIQSLKELLDSSKFQSIFVIDN
jgi:RNA polymerase sigma factor (sigma-70 family)